MAEKFKGKYRVTSARASWWDYRNTGTYLITICTKHLRYHFGEICDQNMYLSRTGQKASEFWREIPQHFPNVLLGEFVIMPNHIHGILLILDPDRIGSKGFFSSSGPGFIPGFGDRAAAGSTFGPVETLHCNDSTHGKWVASHSDPSSGIRIPAFPSGFVVKSLSEYVEPLHYNASTKNQEDSRHPEAYIPAFPSGFVVEALSDYVEPLHCNVSTKKREEREQKRYSGRRERNTNREKNLYMSSISPKPGSISTIIRSFKSAVTRAVRPFDKEFAWQSRFHDHIIRNEQSLHQHSFLIRANPILWKYDKYNCG